VGTVILPTVAILALLLTPFIDRSRMVKVRQRTLAMGVVLLAGIGWGGLTLAAIKGTPPQTAAASIDFSGPTQWMQLKPAELSGIHYYKDQNCVTCHNVTVGGEAKPGPYLLNTGQRHDKDWMLVHFKQPEATSPGSAMAPVNLTAPQMNDLAAAMLALTPDNGDLITNTPEFAADGAALYQKNFCFACHMVNGVGGKTGPVLNGLGTRRSEAWTAEHFVNPQKMSPGTPMPPYKFARKDMQDIISYLFTLPDKVVGQ
jgi:mono/diheme cytochrome c family protein